MDVLIDELSLHQLIDVKDCTFSITENLIHFDGECQIFNVEFKCHGRILKDKIIASIQPKSQKDIKMSSKIVPSEPIVATLGFQTLFGGPF